MGELLFGFLNLLDFLDFLDLTYLYRQINPLYVGHGSRVRKAGAELDDPAISSLPVAASRRHIGEELTDDLLVSKEPRGLASGMNISPLSERNQSLGYRTQSLRLCQGCPDSTFANQGTGQARKESLPLAGVPL